MYMGICVYGWVWVWVWVVCYRYRIWVWVLGEVVMYRCTLFL